MKSRIRDIRRRDIQQTAFDLLAEEGFHSVTQAKIAERLGMSRGLVHHYFKDKDELLEAAVRFGNRLVSEGIAAALRDCTSPRERLRAICEGNFSLLIYTPGRTQYWLSYCAHATFTPRFTRLLNAQNARMRSNLRHEFYRLLPRSEARAASESLSILMDGIWMRMAVTGIEPTREEALAMLDAFIDRLLVLT